MRQRGRIGGLDDRQGQVEDLEHALEAEADQGGHQVDAGVGQLGQRPVELGHVQGQGDDGADLQRPGDGLAAAQRVGQRGRQRPSGDGAPPFNVESLITLATSGPQGLWPATSTTAVWVGAGILTVLVFALVMVAVAKWVGRRDVKEAGTADRTDVAALAPSPGLEVSTTVDLVQPSSTRLCARLLLPGEAPGGGN